MDRTAFQGWLNAYVEAWKTYDPERIGALFSADAQYRYHPQDEPLRGRQAIVDSWLEERDPPGAYAASYQPLAIDGEVHVAEGVSRYFDGRGELQDEYCNIFICRFDDDRLCTDFTEYWIQNREFRRRAGQPAAT